MKHLISRHGKMLFSCAALVLALSAVLALLLRGGAETQTARAGAYTVTAELAEGSFDRPVRLFAREITAEQLSSEERYALTGVDLGSTQLLDVGFTALDDTGKPLLDEAGEPVELQPAVPVRLSISAATGAVAGLTDGGAFTLSRAVRSGDACVQVGHLARRENGTVRAVTMAGSGAGGVSVGVRKTAAEFNSDSFSIYYVNAISAPVTVTYHKNDGTDAADSLTVGGGSASLIYYTGWSREGYCLRGWANSEENAVAGEIAYAEGGRAALTEDIDLWAVWEVYEHEGWELLGTESSVEWSVDAAGMLTIQPVGYDGATVHEGSFTSLYMQTTWPWYEKGLSITSVRVNGTVHAFRSLTGMFTGCENLISVYLSGLDTAGVTELGGGVSRGAFAGCKGLRWADLSGWDLSGVTDASNLFEGCVNLSELNLTGWKLSGVQRLSNLFAGCASLETLDLSGFNTARVIDMSGMFDGCARLHTVTVSDSFENLMVESDTNMFRGCVALMGGCGTSYTEAHSDSEYARIDAMEEPGYFTGAEGSTPRIGMAAVTEPGERFTEPGLLVTAAAPAETTLAAGAGGTLSAEAGGYAVAAEVPEGCFDEPVRFYARVLTAADLTAQESFALGETDPAGVELLDIGFARLDGRGQKRVDENGRYIEAEAKAPVRVSLSVATDTLAAQTDELDGGAALADAANNADAAIEITHLQTREDGGVEAVTVANSFPEDTERAEIAVGAEETAVSFESGSFSIFVVNTMPHPLTVTYHKNDGSGTTLVMPSASGVPGYETRLAASGWTRYSDDGNDGNDFYLAGWAVSEGGEAVYREGDTIQLTGDLDLWAVWAAYTLPDGHTSANAGLLGTESDVEWFYTDGVLTIQPVGYPAVATGAFTCGGFAESGNGAAPWKNYRSSILTVRLNGRIRAFGSLQNLFYNCNAMTAVVVPDGEFGLDTAGVTGMGAMFCGCSELIDLDVSRFDTSSVTTFCNGSNYGMFANCKKLRILDISHFDVSNAVYMKDMFNGCSALSVLDVSAWQTPKLVNMSGMFMRCSGITALDLSGFDTSHVTSMANTFAYCSGLTTLDLSSFDTSNVTSFEEMFRVCSSLQNLNISSFDTKKVTSMSRMFWGCSQLVSLDLRHFDTSSVTSMAGMFYSCSSLSTLHIESFDTSKVTTFLIGGNEGIFTGCSSLTSLDLRHFDLSNVTDMRVAFSGCSNLTELKLTGWKTSKKLTQMSGMFSTCNKLTALDLSGFVTSNVTNMTGLFRGCSALTELDLRSFDTAKVTDFSSMFYGCFALQKLDISSFNTESAVTMNRMFEYCRSIKNLDLSRFNTPQLVDMGAMFTGCSNLKNLNVTQFNTANVTTVLSGGNEGLFGGCSSLTELDLSSFDTSKMNNIGYMFCGCSNLKTIYVGSGFTTDHLTNDSAFAYLFSGCTKLVGGQGTPYSGEAANTTPAAFRSFARIDDKNNGHPGYFTNINDADRTVTFALYDDKQSVQKTKNGTGIVLPSFTRVGYTFTGWKDETDVDHAPGETVTITTDRVFRAQWTEDAYIVSFIPLGGTGTMVNQTFTAVGVPFNLSPNTFKRNGYDYNGWNTSADGTGTAYADGQEVNTAAEPLAPAPLELYAQWAPHNYTVQFNPNGGTIVTNTQGFTYGNPAEALYKASDLTLAYTDHTFTGWKDESGKTYTDGQIVRNLTADKDGVVTLFAQWEANSVTITFNGNGATQVKDSGGVSVKNMTPQTVPYNTAATLWRNTYYQPGHRFTGWNTAADGSGTAYKNGEAVTLTEDVTLYAQWDAAHKHSHEGEYSSGSDITFVKWSDAVNGGGSTVTFTSSADIYLDTDLTGDGGKRDIVVRGSGTVVNLCLNGHELHGTGSGSVITVETGATLNLCDCAGDFGRHYAYWSGSNSAVPTASSTGPVISSTIPAAGITYDTIDGGIVTGGNTSEGGGGIRVDRGTLNLYGGTIAGNTETNDDTNSDSGGGICVDHGNLTMYGGRVAYNFAASWGGGMRLKHCAAVIGDGARIDRNLSKWGGGGIGLARDNSSFLMTGGVIEENLCNNTHGSSASVQFGGGGIFIGTTYNLAAGSICKISGGVIRNNVSNYRGAGVSVESTVYGGEGLLTMTGGTVAGNTRLGDAKASNVYLPDGKKIRVDAAMAAGASIGVTTERKPESGSDVVLTSGYDAAAGGANAAIDPSKVFTSDEDYRVAWDTDGKEAVLTTAHRHRLLPDAGATLSDGTPNPVITFAEWNADDRLPTGGKYYLPKNVKLTAAANVTHDLTLCLNGHELDQNRNVIEEQKDITLSISDCYHSGTHSGAEYTHTHADPVNGGNYTVSGGLVTNTVSGGYTGGDATFHIAGTFNLYGGTFRGYNETKSGSGILVWGGGWNHVSSNAVMNMYGGSISGNKTGKGAAICAYNSTVNLFGGTISGNEALGGGAVAIVSSTMNMYGGTISENTAHTAGISDDNGTVCVTVETSNSNYAKTSTFNMYGGTVTKNKSDKGGGVYLRYYPETYNTVFNLYGGTILGNTGSDGTTPNNVYLEDGEQINVAGALALPEGAAGPQIGVTTHTAPTSGSDVVFTTGYSGHNPTGDPSRYFFADQAGYYVAWNTEQDDLEEGTEAVLTTDPHRHRLMPDQGRKLTDGTTANGIKSFSTGLKQTDFSSGAPVLRGGSYYLTEDIVLNQTLAVTGEVYLCLNGHTITQTAGIVSVIHAGAGSTLNLCDCDGDHGLHYAYWNKTGSSGNISDWKPVVTAVKPGAEHVVIKGGIITGGHTEIDNNGEASNQYGGGLDIGDSDGVAALNLYGGTVAGNTKGYGGGVSVHHNGSSFRMYGGTISFNKSTWGGGGVYVADGTFNLTGGTVSGNTAANGGGVYLGGSGTLSMSGGAVIGGNSAIDGGGIYHNSTADLALTAGTIGVNGSGSTANTATSNKGTNDSGGGGGIYIAANRTARLGGSLSVAGNMSHDHGGGIYSAGKLYLSGGSVTGNRAQGSAGAVANKGGGIWSKGTFEMTGGTVSGNYAKNGGGICVYGGTTEIKGGTIGGTTDADTNRAGDGGGGILVYQSSAVLKLSGNVEIRGNQAVSKGGGIYMYSGKTEADGAGFYGNSVGGGSGGAICMYGGTLTLANTVIGGESAELKNTSTSSNGSGIYLRKGTLELNNGTVVTGNAGGGGGVVVSGLPGVTIKASGNVQVTNNAGGNLQFHWDRENDVYRQNLLTVTGALVDPADSTKRSRIGVSLSNMNVETDGVAGVFTTGYNENSTYYNSTETSEATGVHPGNYFFSDNASYDVLWATGGTTEARLGAAHVHALNGGSGSLRFRVWTGSGLPDSADPTNYGGGVPNGSGGKITFGGWYIDRDLSMASTWVVHTGENTLCLNGHVVSGNGNQSVVKVGTKTTLNLCECQTGKTNTITFPADGTEHTVNGGVITGGKGSGEGSGGGSTMYGGGVYVGESSATPAATAIFNLYGGNIAGNSVTGNGSSGAGVFVLGGKFNLHGGHVCWNWAYDATLSSAAGVLVDNGGVFTMDGGYIENNLASNNGGGLLVYRNGSAEIKNGYIQNNTAERKGGGIYLDGNSNTAKVKFSGGTVSGNTVTDGGDGYGGGGVHLYRNAEFTMLGGSIGAAAYPNTAQQGGGVYIAGGTFMMRKPTGSETASGTPAIEYNTATGGGSDEYNGGGVYVASGGTFQITKANGGDAESAYIRGNSAKTYGGGVYVASGGTFTQQAGTVGGTTSERNQATGGAGVYTAGTYALGGSGVVSGHGDATTHGGGVYVAGGEMSMSGGEIKSNAATQDGGGIYVAGGTFMQSGGTVGGTTSEKNTAQNGGGVYVNGGGYTLSGTGTVSGNTASGTAATNGGGGIYVAGGSFEQSGGTVGGDSAEYKNTAQNGGGVYVNGQTVTLSGAVKYNAAIGYNDYGGGAVYLNGGKLIIKNGAEIDYNTSNRRGGAIIANAAEIDMQGGHIRNNRSGSNGGGGAIWMNISSANKMTMSDGMISENVAASTGGGVLAAGGSFAMSGGTISGNRSTLNGAGVSVYGNVSGSPTTFTMTGGSIINNASSQGGGGVYVNHTNSDAVFYMSGGNITGNTAVTNGGGVLLENTSGSTMNLSGGIIGGAAADRNNAAQGGGIYVSASATLNVSGNPAVTGNTLSDATTANNIYLIAEKNITVTGRLTGTAANIGVTCEDTVAMVASEAAGRRFTTDYPTADTTNVDQHPAAFFFSDVNTYIVEWNDAENKTNAKLVIAASNHKHNHYGEHGGDAFNAHGSGWTGDGRSPDYEQPYYPWAYSDHLPTSAGYWYLTDNVTLSTGTTWEAPDGVHLCLNGFKIIGDAAHTVITVNTNRTVHVTECDINGGKAKINTVTSTAPSPYNGNKTVNGGVITGGKADVYSTRKNSSNQYYLVGGGVCANGGTFYMYGGNIAGNDGGYAGGGVAAVKAGDVSGTVVLTGDTNVCYNKAEHVDGIYIEGANCTLSENVKVHGHNGNTGTIDFYGAGVTHLIEDNVEFYDNQNADGIISTEFASDITMTGGYIHGNTCKSVIHAYGTTTLTLSGGRIEDNTITVINPTTEHGAIRSNVSVVLSGNPLITGNKTTEGVERNLVLPADIAKKITISDTMTRNPNATEGKPQIGITLADYTACGTTDGRVLTADYGAKSGQNRDTAPADNFFGSDNEEYMIVWKEVSSKRELAMVIANHTVIYYKTDGTVWDTKTVKHNGLAPYYDGPAPGFNGWYRDSVAAANEYDFYAPVTADLKLYQDVLSGIKNATASVGGLAGSVNGTVSVTNSFAASVVKANSDYATAYAGGLIGSAGGTLTVSGSYADCYLRGSVLGGFAGKAAGAKLTDAYAAVIPLGVQPRTVAAQFVGEGDITGGSGNYYSLFDFGSGANAVRGWMRGTQGVPAASRPAGQEQTGTVHYFSGAGDRWPYNNLGLHHYGDWNAPASYTVKFVTSGGDIGDLTAPDGSTLSGEPYSGYDWFLAPSCESKDSFRLDDGKINRDMILYGKPAS